MSHATIKRYFRFDQPFWDVGAQVLNVCHPQWNAQGDGTTPDFPAISGAMTAALAQGGAVVYFPSGSYSMAGSTSGALQLPPDNSSTQNWLVFRGAGKDTTTIKLTSDTPRFLDFAKAANYDQFRNILIEDLTIDANNIAGQSHVVLGNYIANAAQTGLNIENITVKNVRVINVPTNTSGSNFRWVFGFAIKPVQASDSTQLYFRNITFEDVRIEGGNEGIMLTGTVAVAGTVNNLLISNVKIHRCYHDTGTVPTGVFTSGNFYVGGYAYVNDVSIRDCIGKGAGDVGIEVDGADHALVEGNIIEDAFNDAILFTNFQAPNRGVHAQRLIAKNNTTRVLTATGDGHFAGVEIKRNNSIGIGHVEIDGHEHYLEVLPQTTSGYGAAVYAPVASGTRPVVDSVTMNKVKWIVNGAHRLAASTGNINHSAIWLDLDGARIKLDGLDVYASLTTDASAGQANLIVIRMDGNNVIWDIDGVTIAASGTFNGAAGSLLYGAQIGVTGSDQPHTIRGSIRRFRLLTATNWATGSVRAIAVSSATLLTAGIIRISDCDFSTNPGTVDVVFLNSPDNKLAIHFDRNVWKTFPIANSSVAIGTSPYEYQNLDGYAEDLLISGGTVSDLSRKESGGTYRTVGVVAGSIFLNHGDTLQVTHTGAPTVRKFPRI